MPRAQGNRAAALWKTALILVAVYAGLIVLPHLLSFSQKEIAVFLLINVLLVVSYRVLTLTGEWSLGHAVIMGVGAYACYKLTTFFPDVNIIIMVLLSGFFAAGIGMIFGLPSLRIKGFYLVVTTLAAQFFLEWCFIRVGWLYNYNDCNCVR